MGWKGKELGNLAKEGQSLWEQVLRLEDNRDGDVDDELDREFDDDLGLQEALRWDG